MQRFSFHVQRGKFSGSPIIEADLENSAAAWRAALDICTDLARDICESLTPADPQWLIAVKNEADETIFRFRLIGEIPNNH
jgi:uncharacterized protein DUF6894